MSQKEEEKRVEIEKNMVQEQIKKIEPEAPKVEKPEPIPEMKPVVEVKSAVIETPK